MNDKVNEIVCETQGEIYQLAKRLLYEKEEFSEKYLTSNFCNREMDAAYSPFQFADAEECMDFVKKEFVPKTSMEQYTDNKAYWIGYMYRKMQIVLKISSYDLSKKIPFFTMANYYEGLHTIDDESAIDIIMADLAAGGK